MAGNVLKVSITGIDGVGKSSVIEATLKNLSGLNVGIEYIPFDASRNDIFGKLDQLLEKGWLFAERHGDKIIPTLGYTLTTLLCKPRAFYRFYLLKERHEIMIRHRDPIIDAVVYFGFYWGIIDRMFCLNPRTKVKMARQLIREELPDVLIHLTVDPKVAMMRIMNRLKEHGKKKINHFHETEESLNELQDIFRETIKQAQEEKSSMKVFWMDTTEASLDELGERSSEIIKAFLS